MPNQWLRADLRVSKLGLLFLFHARKLNILRRQMTKEEREEIMVAMRKDSMSYRQIAEVTGVDHKTAINVIEKTGGEISPPVIKGADGKQYPAIRGRKLLPPQTALFVTSDTQQDVCLSTIQRAKEQAQDDGRVKRIASP